MINSKYNAEISCSPREKDKVYIPAKKKKLKKIWTFPISLFKDWRKDDQEILNSCFEADWNNCRINKLVKNEEDLSDLK